MILVNVTGMVFQSSLGIGTERFYKCGRRIVDALVLPLSKIVQKVARAEVLARFYQAIKGAFEMYGEDVKRGNELKWVDIYETSLGWGYLIDWGVIDMSLFAKIKQLMYKSGLSASL